MSTGYTRNDLSNNISDQNIIEASDLDGEFDAIQAAFSAVTGHSHDGTVGEGGPIISLGPAQEVVATSTALRPKSDNSIDLGTSAQEFRDLYIDGVAYIDDLRADTVNLDGGVIDNTVIGGTTPAAGTFTTLAATSATIGGTAVVNISDVQTLTNKTINLSNNTLVATSSQIAAAVTDKTGSGSLVFSSSPELTGTPLAPTAAAGTNTTQIATTAFVQNSLSGSGLGDMLKAVYDTNNDGSVNAADKWNTPRTITIGNTGKSLDGTSNVSWTLAEIGAIGTDLSVTPGSTAGPTINSSTGADVVIPSASATASGVVTTGAQTFGGTKTFSTVTTGTANITALNLGGTAITATGTEINYTDGVTSNIQTQLSALSSGKQDVDSDLTAIANLGTTGLMVRTGTGTAVTRVLEAGTGITISQAGGINGNPVISSSIEASGTAPLFACRAYVQFIALGAINIQKSGNVSSVVDDGVGKFTVNFTTPMSTSYALLVSAEVSDSFAIMSEWNTGFTVWFYNSSNALVDPTTVSAAVFC